MKSQYLALVALISGLTFLVAGLAPSPLAANSPLEVDIQVDVYGDSVVFHVGSSRDLLSLNVRVVGPQRYVFEDRIELFGTLQWTPDPELADGDYSWEAWVVTANPGAALRDLPAGTAPNIAIEHFYQIETTQTHVASGRIRMLEGTLESIPALRPGDDTSRVRRVASAILNFLVPSAHAQNYTDNVTITKSVPEYRYEHTGAGARNFSTGFNPLNGWYVRDLTANTFPFVVQAEAPNSSLVIRANGNLGIGTGAPNSKLDVVGGSVRMDNHLTIRNPSSSSVTSLNLNADNSDSVNAGSWRLINDASEGSRFEIREGGTTQRLTIVQGGQVGIGTTAPQSRFHVQNISGWQIRLGTGSSADHRLDSFGDQLAIGATSAQNQFVIRSSAPNDSLKVHDDGNIGVGTSTPAASVHVQRADNSARVTVEDTGATTSADIMFLLRNNGNPQFRMQNTATDRVWNFRMQDFGECSTSNTCFVINKRNGPRFRFMQDGDMFIEGSYEQSSSRTVKSAVSALASEELLAKLQELSVYEWSYIHNPETRHVGPMAEDFYSAFGLGSGDKSISPANMAGVSLAAAKILHERVAAAEALNQSILGENAELRARIERMEATLADRF